jgi:hypothetical protein
MSITAGTGPPRAFYVVAGGTKHRMAPANRQAMGRPSGLSRFSTKSGETSTQTPLTRISHPSPTKRASTGLQSATEQHDAPVSGIVRERYHSPIGELGSAPGGGSPNAEPASSGDRNRLAIARDRIKPMPMMQQRARTMPYRGRARRLLRHVAPPAKPGMSLAARVNFEMVDFTQSRNVGPESVTSR